MIEMVKDPNRPIAPYGTDACRDTVNTWCKRVLDRDPSIALERSEWIIDDTPTTADSLLTDAIWCQLWYASRAKRDADLMAPQMAYELLKFACLSYKHAMEQLMPKRATNDVLHAFSSPLTCALNYLECREAMLKIIEDHKAQGDLSAKSVLCGSRACIQMICSKFSHKFTSANALQTSADALYYKAASMKHANEYGSAYPLFVAASERYGICGDGTKDRAIQEAQTCKMCTDECGELDAEFLQNLFRIDLVRL